MANCVVCSNDIRDDARFCPSCGAEQPKPGPAPGSGDDPFIGQVVARNFKIESLLGVGGMGKVYKARQLSLDKVVVIKILHDHFRDDPQLVQRFQREARAASRLNHPNSIQVIDFGQDENNVLYMAIEYLEGKDLFSALRDEGPLAPDRIARILMQVCSALAEAHEQHVIHRDLKPENIMVEDRRGQRDFVKVLDFGIAKIQDPENTQGQALTQAGMVCGTPEYMSPEQARGLSLDARSDLYSLGVLAYQLATGELPFMADTPIGIVTKHILEEPVPPRQKRPELPEALEAVILRAMAKDANARFQSAIEMGEAFEALLRAPTAPVLAAPQPTGTLVGAPVAPVAPVAPAPPRPTTGPVTGTSAAPPPPPASTQMGLSAASPTEDSQPVVRTVSADALISRPAGGASVTSPSSSGIVGAVSDDLDVVSPKGGGLKWAALAGLLAVAVAGGALFAMKDSLFGGDDAKRGGGVALADPSEAKEPAGGQGSGTAPVDPSGAASGDVDVAGKPPVPDKPVDAKPDDDSKVVDAKPADAKPADAKPTDAKPKPVDAKPPRKTPEPRRNDAPKRASDDDRDARPKRDGRINRDGERPGRGKRVSAEKRRRAKELHARANGLALSEDRSKRDQAYRMLREALELDPSTPDPLQVISFIHRKNGDADKACGAMKAFVKQKGLGRTRGTQLLKGACKDFP